MGVQGGGGIFGGGGHSSTSNPTTTTTTTNASTGEAVAGTNSQSIAGVTLTGDNPSLTLTDQGSLRAALAIVQEAFQSIDTNTHLAAQGFDRALSSSQDAFQAAASAATPGGTFDTQKVILVALGVGAIIAVAVILKK